LRPARPTELRGQSLAEREDIRSANGIEIKLADGIGEDVLYEADPRGRDMAGREVSPLQAKAANVGTAADEKA